jgi:hypothetical protein
MSKQPRYPNTQTAADRTLWRKIKRHLAKKLRAKRKQYRLSSNRAARLYLPDPPSRIARGKIIPFRIS